MRIDRILPRSRPYPAAACCLTGALVALGGVAPARAQVIEIGDDGGTRVFSGPTRFVGGEIGPKPAAAGTTQADPAGRFERIARAEGVDARLLRAIAWTESRGRTDAVSPKGAVGIMQLMPATAAALGVDPRDPDANIAGGARYLARMMSRFGNVPLALAAYNAGPGAVLRWGGIPPYAETRAYVASILSRWRNGSVMPLPTVIQPARVNTMLIEVP